MTDIIGYCPSSVIALGIMFIGARFAFAPHAAAAAYGVSVGRDPRWEAYLSVKAVRDIACGLFTAILILNRSAHLLGWFMAAATIIPLAEAQSFCDMAEQRPPHSASTARPPGSC